MDSPPRKRARLSEDTTGAADTTDAAEAAEAADAGDTSDCVRKCNEVDSREFFVRFTSDVEVTEEKEAELIRWMTKRLAGLDTEVSDGDGHYPWNIVFDVVPGYREVPHWMRASIHMRWRGGWEEDEDNLIILNEIPPIPTLEPERILECLVGQPDWVTGIGVSGVSRSFASCTWWSIIDGPTGFQSHPMWVKMPNGKWFTVRDRSFNFGWEDYPPENK